MDPELEAILPFLPEVDLSDIPAARDAIEELMAGLTVEIPGIDSIEVEDLLIPGPAESPEVQVRVYRPRKSSGPVGAVLYIHGGGFVLGSIETEHGGSAAIAIDLGVVVVSVDYRLAPENPFPAGLEDCYAALVWLAASGAALGVDLERVAVVGSSAGGGLAAALALLARDRGGPNLCFQLLGIPELDDRLDTWSMRTFVETPLWNRPAAERSWAAYLGRSLDEAPGLDVSAYAAPARADDLADLPSAYISTAEHDPLRDEGLRYGMRLLEAGVSVELHQFPGTFHGSQMVSTAAVSRRMQREYTDVLRAAVVGVSG